MSDPVTNAEVEDVLSSIRRLVSEEKRPVTAAKTVSQSDRLVLTPALRIEEEAPAEEAPDRWATFRSERHDVVEDDVAEAKSDADDAQAYQLENPQIVPDDSFADDFSEEVAPQDVARDATEDDYAADPYNFDDADDVDGESDAIPALAPETREAAQLAPLEETATDDAETSVVDMPMPETKAATLSAKIEALESAIGGIEDDFEPDEPCVDAYSGSDDMPMAWEAELSEKALSEDADLVDDYSPAPQSKTIPLEEIAEVEPELADEILKDISQESLHAAEERIEEAVVAAASAQAQQDDQPFAFPGDDRVIDEEALRDMVGDIVRAELQGALGERITRNVRKLVRREIHRALTTQDLE